jgi:hypothetical protein
MPQQFEEQATDYDYQQTYNYTYGLLDAGFPAFPTAQATSSAQAIVTGAIAKTTTTARATSVTQSPVPGVGLTARALAQTSLSTTTTSAAQSILQQRATSASRTTITDADLIQSAVEWRLVVDGDEIDELYDVAPVVDTANPFGDFAVLKMDDTGGRLFDKFPRGAEIQVDISTNFGLSFDTRFIGYAVERREREQSGADVLEVEAYSFDQFLRRNRVSNDQTGKQISTALADIIQTDTPVAFVPGNVSVGDDAELTRPLQGEPVESVLRLLSFASENEAFGVNRQREFFFRPRETQHIDRGISNTQWFDYDIPELGKRALNEVEVFFDGGSKSVIVDNPDDKLDLQDSLSLADPGTQRKEVSRPSITDISDAEDVGRKILKFRNTTLTGEVTTFGLFDAQPGDTIDIRIDARGIDDEFLIAAVEYQWGRDETVITIVEQRGDVDDLLIDINDSVKRQETQDANRNAPKNRITSTTAGAIVDPTVDLDGVPVDDARIVNDGRRAIRDGLADNSLPDITDIAVGDDGTGLSRSNTTLRNETARASVIQTLPDSDTVTFEASLTQSDVQEVGLLTASGTLIARATVDTPTSVSGPVTVTLDVRNDERPSRSVLTNTGQTTVRDVLANNNPGLPKRYAYGSDNTPVAETDTALGNQVISVNFAEEIAQEADTSAEFSSISTISAKTPIDITNGTVKLRQSTFVAEGEASTNTTTSGSIFSDGAAGRIVDAASGDITLTFNIDYTVPNSNAEIYIRAKQARDSVNDPSPATVNIVFDGIEAAGSQVVGPLDPDIEWRQFDIDSNNGDVTPGSHTVRIEFDAPFDNGAQDFDVLAFVDNRFKTFGSAPDNTLNTSGGFLDGPALFPDLSTVTFDQASTRQDFQTGTLDTSFNDTSGKQFIQVARGSTTRRFDNEETASYSFNTKDNTATTTLGLSRFDNGAQSATPRFNYLGQSVSAYELLTEIDQPTTDDINEILTRAVIAPNTVTGSTFREAGLLDGNSNLLTRHILAEFDVLQDQRVASSETTTINETE